MTGLFIEDRQTDFIVCVECGRIIRVGALDHGIAVAADHMRTLGPDETVFRRGKRLTKVLCAGSMKPTAERFL